MEYLKKCPVIEKELKDIENSMFIGLYKVKGENYFLFRYRSKHGWIAIPDNVICFWEHGEKFYKENIYYAEILGNLYIKGHHGTGNIMLEQLTGR